MQRGLDNNILLSFFLYCLHIPGLKQPVTDTAMQANFDAFMNSLVNDIMKKFK